MSRVLGGSKPRLLGVLAVVGVLLAAAMVLEMQGFPAGEPLPMARPQAPATEGIWYCALTAGEGGRATLSVAAAGATRSSISVEHYLPGRPEPGAVASLAPGEQLDVRLDGERAAAPVAVRWEGGPAVATWQGGAQAAVPCTAQPSDRWYLTGFDTVQASSVLHLLNPFDEDAAARVAYATPEGRVELTLTDDLLIEGGSVRRLDLRQYQPEVANLGVIVEVLSGRLVAAGEVLVDPPEGGEPSGRVSLAAAPTPSRDWSFAFARVDDTASSWLSVMNPWDRAAAVEVQVTDPKQAGMPAEVSIPPGGVERVDLAELSSAGEFAVAVRSVNDVPVVAARFSAQRGPQGLPALSGGLGAAQPATVWALATARAGEHGATVGVFNPEGQPAAVSLLTVGASNSWAVFELPANGRVAVDLPAAASERLSVPMLVRADAPVVAELRSAAPGTESWTAIGVPERSWSGPPSRPEVRWDPGLWRTPAVRTEDP